MNGKTQKQLILDYMKSGNKISQRKAIAYFNVIRLSSVIYYLKEDGYEIGTIRKKSLFNNSTYVEYYLKNNL